MADTMTIAPLTTVVTFAFAALIVGGLVVYLALTGRREKK